MSLTARSCLSSMIWLALSGLSMAQDASNAQITSDPSSHISEDYTCLSEKQRVKNIQDAPISILSDYAETKGEESSHFSGDVVITQGHRTIKADSATLTQPNNILSAEGNIFFHDGEIAISGTSLYSVIDTEDSMLENANYKMLCSPGRGEAKQVFKNGTALYELEDGTYTTCPDSDDSWRFKAGKIEKEDGELFANLYQTRFEILNTPVFYLPYIRVPVEEGRLTGFLYPSISFNDINGIETKTPFYWNIAPQMDAVITPTYMTNRGLFFNAQPRYLSHLGSGSVNFEYMGHDKAYADYVNSWAVDWRHNGLSNHWKYDIDYSKVSDIDYFTRHTESQIGSREDNTLLQTASLAYRSENWNSAINVRAFQSLSPSVSAYRLLPQIDFNYYLPDTGLGFDFHLPTQISQFDNLAADKPDAMRVSLQPTFIFPYTLPWLTASAESKLFYTHYEQKNIKNIRGTEGEKLETSVTRSIPMTKLNATMILERSDALGNYHYTQTLEPQLQYLYIQKKDQSGIYNPVNYANGGYDTSRLQTDYYGLFRANQYSSIDYINPANQFTFGASTRFFNDKYKEIFNLAFGQIYYLNREELAADIEYDYSAWAIESELNLFDDFSIRGSVEYDHNLSNLQFGNATAEYQNNGFMLQTSYRYVSEGYIASTTGQENLDLITKDGISQFGLISSFPIGEHLSFQGQYFHDFSEDMMLENQVGLIYRSACWSIGLSYNQYLLSRDNINQPTMYDNNISLSFSLLGLGANSDFGYSTAQGNSLGYRNPFGLNN